ncbi:MAG: STAS domain-containing protein [Chitinivibrionales bacterium]|nr:STAS domain-containing protein [Chitinivibrionales bacterium]
MNINAADFGDTEIIYVEGEIAGANIVELQRAVESLKNSSYRRICIELSKATYINSQGLGGLIYLHKVISKHGKELIILSPSNVVRSLIRTCCFDTLFTVGETACITKSIAKS